MAKSAGNPGEIVIELDDGRNSRIEFPPLMDWFRGRWSPTGLPPGSASRGSTLCQLDMPGQRIALDVANRQGRVFDPLDEPENKAALQMYDGIVRAKDALHRGSRAVPELVRSQLQEDELASWWYWMHEMVVVRKVAKLVSGSFDKQPPGDPKLDYYSVDPHVPRTLSEMEQWRAGKWRSGKARPDAD